MDKQTNPSQQLPTTSDETRIELTPLKDAELQLVGGGEPIVCW
ncbi:MAG TPA: hypothetical protein VFV17_04240 [Usitatibacteraceae bacterium]|nr:hypothetical protein [Usitatibacteraceae bacterium]